MQEIQHDGTKGPWEEFDYDKMMKRLEDPKVKEFRVKKTTEDNMRQAKNRAQNRAKNKSARAARKKNRK